MKCPKCGYLGFEHIERCRNCGYDFSLAQTAPPPELTIRAEAVSEADPVDDLALIDAAAVAAPLPPWQLTPDLEKAMTTLAPPVAPPSSELPLFDSSSDDDAPMITRPSRPRPPLAVRRATPEVPRARSEQPRSQLFDLAASAVEASKARPNASPAWSRPEGPGGAVDREPAGLGARVVAVAIDLTILAAIDAAVVYFTMQICGIAPQELHLLSKAPLAAFLIVQNGGYLVAFTVGGQTLGKMAAGIKVVAADSDLSLDLSQSVVRTLVWVVLAVPAGLGFLTALFSRDHRGLHDLVAGTRVVRAAF